VKHGGRTTRTVSIDHVVFVLAEDPISDEIVDDSFMTTSAQNATTLLDAALKRPNAHFEALKFCEHSSLKLLDFDGPFQP
jgi:hypothetical protein